MWLQACSVTLLQCSGSHTGEPEGSVGANTAEHNNEKIFDRVPTQVLGRILFSHFKLFLLFIAWAR